VLAHHRLHLGGVGEQHVPLRLRIALACLVDEGVGLLRKPPGVDGDDPDVRPHLVRHVQHDHAVGLQRSDDGDPVPERIQCPLDDVFGLLIVEVDRDLADLQVVEDDPVPARRGWDLQLGHVPSFPCGRGAGVIRRTWP
jgi:hypothetical protein